MFANRDSMPSMYFRHSLAAVSKLLLSYAKKDIDGRDHNPLFCVFYYIDWVVYVNGSDPIKQLQYSSGRFPTFLRAPYPNLPQFGVGSPR
jgi:hypothetical protein